MNAGLKRQGYESFLSCRFSGNFERPSRRKFFAPLCSLANEANTALHQKDGTLQEMDGSKQRGSEVIFS
jgi:hypothetical protein